MLDVFKPKQLRRINACRMYLQAVTLADITNGLGTNFTNCFLCEKDPDRTSPYVWPQQHRPGKKSIRLWKKALRMAFPRVNNKLQQQLGNWYKKPPSWKWWYTTGSNRLFRRCAHTWKVYSRQGRGRTGSNPKYSYLCDCIHPPPLQYPATVLHFDNFVRLTGYSSISHMAEPSNNVPRWGSHTLLQCSNLFSDMDKVILREHIQQGTATIVSNGSYLPDHKVGAAAWVIDLADNNIIGKGHSQCPGSKEDQCSY